MLTATPQACKEQVGTELGLEGAWTQQEPQGPHFPASLYLSLQGANWGWRLWTCGALIWNLDLDFLSGSAFLEDRPAQSSLPFQGTP